MEISLSLIFLLFKTSIYRLLRGKINTNQSTIIPGEIAKVLKSELHVICNALRGKIGTIMVLARSDDEKLNVNCLVTWKARFDWMQKKKKINKVRVTCKPALESSDHQKVTEHFQLHEKRNPEIF